MFVRNSRIIYLEHNFSKGRVRIWFFGIDWFQIAAIVKWPLVARLLGEPLIRESIDAEQETDRGSLTRFSG
jgi:hypothetical protein